MLGTLAIRFAWTGSPAAGARLLDELRTVAAPLIDDVSRRPYAEVGRIHSDPVEPMPVSSCSALLRDLPPAGLDALLATVGDDSPHTIVELRALGGALARAPRGSHGFGYDPIFVPVSSGITTAEMKPDAKDAISHRGRALRALAPVIAAALA